MEICLCCYCWSNAAELIVHGPIKIRIGSSRYVYRSLRTTAKDKLSVSKKSIFHGVSNSYKSVGTSICYRFVNPRIAFFWIEKKMLWKLYGSSNKQLLWQLNKTRWIIKANFSKTKFFSLKFTQPVWYLCLQNETKESNNVCEDY